MMYMLIVARPLVTHPPQPVCYHQDSDDIPRPTISPGNSDLISPANTSFEEDHFSPRDLMLRQTPSPRPLIRQSHFSNSGESLVSFLLNIVTF